jgi:hypothetical protein
MAIRTKQTGSKGTRRDQLVLTGSPEDMRDTIAHAASQASFESWVSGVEPCAKEILAGCPEPSSADYDNQTPAYYAQSILRRISLIRAAIRRNDPAEAAFYSVQLGNLVCEANMKSDADKAYDQMLSGREGGLKNRGKHAPRDKRMANEYLALRKQKPELSDSRIKELIGKKQKPPLRRSQSIQIIDAKLRRRGYLSDKGS